MFYGTAGAAWERFDETTTLLTPGSFTATTTPTNLFGWVAGLGAEATLLRSDWIVRLEYLHYDFGGAHPQITSTTVGFPTADGAEIKHSTSYAPVCPTNSARTSTADRGGNQTLDVVRAGLSHKFSPDLAGARY